MSGNESIEKKPLIKWGWLRAGLFFLGGFGAMVFVRMAKKAIIHDNENLDGIEAMLVSQLITFAGFMLLMIAFRKLIDRKSITSLGFQMNRTYLKDLLVGLGTGVGIVALIFITLILTNSIVVTRAPEFSAYEFLMFAAIFVVVAFHEEVIWRGYFLNNFMASMNKYVALIMPTIVFALLHGDSPTITSLGLINVVLAGLLLGVYYIHKKNLWFPIGLHFAWNFMEGPICGSTVSGNSVPSIFQVELTGNELITGGGFGFEGSLITSVALVLAILFVHLKYRPTNS